MALGPDFRHLDLVKALPGREDVVRPEGKNLVTQHAFDGDGDKCAGCGKSKDHPIHSIEKHGTKGRPGYRLLHPNRPEGQSHRPMSRGISNKYPNALNVNLKPRPASGLGKPGGKFKDFMVPQGERRRAASVRNMGSVEQRRIVGQRAMSQLKNPPKSPAVARVADQQGRGLQTRFGDMVRAEAAKRGYRKPAKRQFFIDWAEAIGNHQDFMSRQNEQIAANRIAQQAGLTPRERAEVGFAAEQWMKQMGFKVDREPAQRGVVVAAPPQPKQDAGQLADQADFRRDAVSEAARHYQNRYAQEAFVEIALRHEGYRVGDPRQVPAPRFNALNDEIKRDVYARAQQWVDRKNPPSPINWGTPKPFVPQPKVSVPKNVTVKPAQASIKTGMGPHIIAVDVDPEFDDRLALKRFLEMKDVEGNPLFGESGARIIVEDDPNNAALQHLIRYAGRNNIQVVRERVDDRHGSGTVRQRRGNRLEAVDRMIEAEKGRGLVVGFRRPGATVGEEGDLIDLHLRRGMDSRGNAAEAMIIAEGFRGLDDDENAFGLAIEDVAAAGGPAPKSNKALDRVIFAPNDLPQKQGGEPVRHVTPMAAPPGADINGPYNVAHTPAGRHLADGGDVWDAPNEGLAWFMIHNPHRFKQLRLAGGGVSASFGVQDLKTGRRYFVKQAEEGGGGKMVGDAANEVLLADLAERLIPGRGMRARYADDPNLKKTWIVTEHVNDKFGTNKVGRAKPRMGPIANHNEWLASHFFDFLTNQSDRHYNNWLEEDTAEGRRLVLIDHGAAGLGHYGVKGHETYRRWLNIGHLQAPKRFIGAELQEYYRGRAREIERDIDGIMKVLNSIDVEAVASKHITDNGLTGREEAYMQSMVALWKKRLAQLQKDRREVVKFLGGER